MAPRVKGNGVKGHRSSRTTAAAAISTTSTSSRTSVVPDFQSGSLSQQPYLMVPNPGYTVLPPPSWPTPGCMGPPPPPPPPISIPPPLRNSNLLVDSETPGSSSTSPPSETALVPNSVTKERLVPDGKTSWLPFPPGSQKITEIIKKRYDKPYKKFGDVPLPAKKLWFKEWKQLDEYVQSHFLIDDDDDEFFWRAFKYRTSKRFSQMMSDIREGVDTTHEWLIPAYKKVLERYWKTDEK
nr:inverted formin-2-like [Arachis hypogaea]